MLRTPSWITERISIVDIDDIFFSAASHLSCSLLMFNKITN